MGTFAEKESGILYGYQAEINGDIAATTAVRFMELPAQTQGVSFVQEGGKTALLTSCSYGRKMMRASMCITLPMMHRRTVAKSL